MAARFTVVTEEEIAKIKEDSIPKKPKQATKYGLKIFQGKILNFISLRAFIWKKTGVVATRHRAVSEI